MLKKSSNFKVVLPFGNVNSYFFSSCRGTFPKLISSDRNYESFYCEFIPCYKDGFTPLIIRGLLLLTISNEKNETRISKRRSAHYNINLQWSTAVGFSYIPAPPIPNPVAFAVPVCCVAFFIVGLFPFILEFLLFAAWFPPGLLLVPL